MEQHKIVLVLGSNNHRAENISHAQQVLLSLFRDVRFTDCLCTDPIGIDGPQFLNCAASATTTLDKESTISCLKDIEHQMGSTHERRRQGIIDIDIDLLQFDKEKLHKDDWQREYVQKLLEELSNTE